MSAINGGAGKWRNQSTLDEQSVDMPGNARFRHRNHVRNICPAATVGSRKLFHGSHRANHQPGPAERFKRTINGRHPSGAELTVTNREPCRTRSLKTLSNPGRGCGIIPVDRKRRGAEFLSRVHQAGRPRSVVVRQASENAMASDVRTDRRLW